MAKKKKNKIPPPRPGVRGHAEELFRTVEMTGKSGLVSIDVFTDYGLQQLRESVSEFVKDSRRRLGLTMDQFGELFGHTRSWVRDLESGKQVAPAHVLVSLAQATGEDMGRPFRHCIEEKGETDLGKVQDAMRLLSSVEYSLANSRAWALREAYEKRGMSEAEIEKRMKADWKQLLDRD